MNRLTLTRRAEADLEAIFAGMARSFRFFGEEAARRYCEGLTEALDQLAAEPLAGRPEPEIDERTWSQTFRRHAIFYEMAGEGILVLRLLPLPDPPLHDMGVPA
ncbi:MAG: type II toxin-antitoxin system RelE/ParE family toxin [Sphingomonadaceae bacterium]